MNLFMRRFYLNRKEDETGVSGTGIIAEGVEFSNKRIALTWKTQYTSYVFYDSIKDVEHIHGHNGKTELVWIDGPGPSARTGCHHE